MRCWYGYTFRRFMLKRPDLHHVVACLWHVYVHGGVNSPGPIGLLFKAVAALGWHWVSVGCFRRPGRCNLALFDGPDKWWEHELREGLRRLRWSEAASKRNDMKGLDSPHGLDCRASLALMHKSSGVRLGLLRAVLVGSVRLQKRLFEASLVESPICQFCGAANETLGHCLWDSMRPLVRHTNTI